jgi:hypothetical protein
LKRKNVSVLKYLKLKLVGGKNLLTGGQVYMTKKCKQCEKEFEQKDELDMFCGQQCKEEALAELDSDSDECLSCQ